MQFIKLTMPTVHWGDSVVHIRRDTIIGLVRTQSGNTAVMLINGETVDVRETIRVVLNRLAKK